MRSPTLNTNRGTPSETCPTNSTIPSADEYVLTNSPTYSNGAANWGLGRSSPDNSGPDVEASREAFTAARTSIGQSNPSSSGRPKCAEKSAAALAAINSSIDGGAQSFKRSLFD